jgi:hypothetical protein
MRTFRIVAIGVMVMLGLAHAVGAAEAGHLTRVRSTSPRLAAIIEDACERSQTFRGLVATINASDGIVYVQEGQCGHGVRACFTSVTAGGPHRFLWVRIDMARVDWNTDWDLMGAIGHELRHVIEVLNDQTVRDDMTRHLFYALKPGSRSLGSHHAFETDAAIVAGLEIRAEARRRTSRAGEP